MSRDVSFQELCHRKVSKQSLGINVSSQAETPSAAIHGDFTIPQAHTCAITSKGTLYMWGGHREGQLGLGRPTYVSLQPNVVFAAVAVVPSSLLCLSGPLLSTCKRRRCSARYCGRVSAPFYQRICLRAWRYGQTWDKPQMSKSKALDNERHAPTAWNCLEAPPSLQMFPFIDRNESNDFFRRLPTVLLPRGAKMVVCGQVRTVSL